MTKQNLFTLITCAILATGGAFTANAQEVAEVVAAEASAGAVVAPDGGQLFLTRACLSCHGPDGRTPLLPIYPKVAGQNADYLYNQLRDFKNGSRSNGQAAVMLGLMAGVNEEEMRALADWLAAQ